MLVITRRPEERIRLDIGGVIVWITCLEGDSRQGRMRIGIEAPREVRIMREELLEQEEKRTT